MECLDSLASTPGSLNTRTGSRALLLEHRTATVEQIRNFKKYWFLLVYLRKKLYLINVKFLFLLYFLSSQAFSLSISVLTAALNSL